MHLSELNVISEWIQTQVGSCGWFPGVRFWMWLQKQHLQIMMLICITCPRSASQNLEDYLSHDMACKYFKLVSGERGGKHGEENIHLGDVLTSINTPQFTG